jgi:hypothetical protein
MVHVNGDRFVPGTMLVHVWSISLVVAVAMHGDRVHYVELRAGDNGLVQVNHMTMLGHHEYNGMLP